MSDDAKHAAFCLKLGGELRAYRELAGLSQDAVAEVLGWGRDAISKIETGKNGLRLYDYLLLMEFLRDGSPGHPAHSLRERLNSRRLPRAGGVFRIPGDPV